MPGENMLSDLHKHKRCFYSVRRKALITVTLLIGLHGLTHAATEAGGRAMKEQVKALTEELQRLEKAAAISSQNRADKARLAKKQLLLQQVRAEVDKLKKDLIAVQSEKEQIGKEYGHHTKLLRSEAASREIAELKTKKRVYRGVRIKRFDPQGISITHEHGGANLHYTMLPEDWQKKFRFDPEQAAEFAEKDARAREQLRRSLAERRQQELQKAKNREDAGHRTLNLNQDVPAAPDNGAPLNQQEEPKTVDGRISVRVLATKRSYGGHGNSTRKKIKITARAGTEELRVSVSSTGGSESFTVRARDKTERECWVSTSYTVKAYQGGRLVDQESDRKKTGL